MSAQGLHRHSFHPEAGGPLDGLRIVDLSRLVAGNMATLTLADYGAEVIKIEHPERGDDLRAWRVSGVETYWKVYGRNKKSVALDYRAAHGLDVLRRLIDTADVLVENFVPGKLERLGLAPEKLLETNPRLVVLRVSGWGQTGPFRDRPGFGTLVEARSGFASLNGFADRPPVLPPLALADMISGIYGAMAVAVAVRHSERTGIGQVIDLSLFDPILSVLGPMPANYVVSGALTPRQGNRASNAAPRNVYVCRDGKFIALSASMQSVTERLFHAMGRPELIVDPRFSDNDRRLSNIDALDAIVGGFIADRTQQECLALFERAGVTAGPMFDAADLMSDAYVAERESLLLLPDADLGELPMHNVVARFSETPGAIRLPAPRLGQHTDEVLSALQLDRPTIAGLRHDGVIR